MQTILKTATLIVLTALAGRSHAELPAPVMNAVAQFVRAQTAGLPGKVSYTVGDIDSRIVLPPCPAPEVFLPPGARLWGLTSLGVRCASPTAWSIYVNAQVRVHGDYLVTARALAQNQPLTAADLAVQSGDLTQLPAGVITDPQMAVGKTLTVSLAAGQPMRQDLLRAPLVIQQGQTVKLQSTGHGFRVTTDGRSLSNAADGQVAQVRTAGGQTISGIARTGGVVEITF